MSRIDHMLPHLTEPDIHVVNAAEWLWLGNSPKNAPPEFYDYTSLLPHVLALTPAPEVLRDGEGADDLETQLAAASVPVLRMRILSVLFSVLAIPATWFLARRFLDARAALFAAALLATSLMPTLFATQARLHSIHASLALLTVVSALHLIRSPTLLAYTVTGVLAALTVGSLQSGVFVIPALAVAHWMRDSRDGGGEGPGGSRSRPR